MRTLSNAIERLVGRGFTANFGVVGNRLRAFDTGKTFGAHELIMKADLLRKAQALQYACALVDLRAIP